MFDCWRTTHRARDSWGLAWFLANEFCERYYSSHGIAPQVIDHDGLGYYGIKLTQIPCPVNGSDASPLGRLTMFGNVENWRHGSPGDHGLEAITMCDEGVTTSAIVEQAILHMDLSPVPEKTHVRCRHKRRGASYELIFRIATIVALRGNSTAIWNHPDNVIRRIAQTDPQADAPEHPGAFVFLKGERELLVAGDGRVLGATSENLWLDYMRGKSLGSLVEFVENKLD
jgi:hypothetical protein